VGLFSRATGRCPRANATASNALRETNMLTTTTVSGGRDRMQGAVRGQWHDASKGGCGEPGTAVRRTAQGVQFPSRRAARSVGVSTVGV